MEAVFVIIYVVFVVVASKFFFDNKRNKHKKTPTKSTCSSNSRPSSYSQATNSPNSHDLSRKFGLIYYLQLGSRPAIIVSSPSLVEECFTKNDIVLANRPYFIMGKYVSYNNSSMGTSPYGDHWRNLRRIGALEIFSTTRINKFSGIRRDEMEILMKKLYEVSSNYGSFAEVMFSELMFNVIMRMMTGKRYSGEGSEVEKAAKNFRKTITEIFRYADASYPGDFLPFLEWIDYKGYSKRVKELAKRSDELFQGLIDEQRNDLFNCNSMISRLLSLQLSEPQYYTDEIIKGLLVDILSAGTESSIVPIEWAMASLLNNPQILKNVKNEIDEKIGKQTMLDESDITKLLYLQNIISETFRLYPAGPLLLPHFSQSECTIREFHVPKDTIVFINAWAIQRDSELWEDATSFKPERFGQNEGENINFKYMSFGLGRRSCPGMGLANRVIGIALGCMIQCFEWKRIDDKEIDMSEGVGLSMPKAYLLQALCKPRDIMKTFSYLQD